MAPLRRDTFSSVNKNKGRNGKSTRVCTSVQFKRPAIGELRNDDRSIIEFFKCETETCLMNFSSFVWRCPEVQTLSSL
jgi:hypothetical protein